MAYPRIYGGKTIELSDCTPRFSSVCSTTYSNKSQKIMTLVKQASFFHAPCVYCDLVIDTKPMSTLKKGASGTSVKYLQMKLNWIKRIFPKVTTYGFTADLELDGSFGGGTEKALKAVQSTLSLSSDGSAGPATWAKLDTYKEGRTPTQKRPNCTTYSLFPSTSPLYKESCQCYAARNYPPGDTPTLYSCLVACDLQACIHCYSSAYSGSSSTKTCTSDNPCTSCYSSCNSASNTCQPYANANCAATCYGHTAHCPINYDPRNVVESYTGAAACATYTACKTCNSTCYGYKACSSCDKTQYGTGCRQCDQMNYYVDDYYEDYL